MQVRAFYDAPTYTVSFVVWDENTRDAVVIDPVLDYDVLASQTKTDSVEALVAFVKAEGLKLHWVLETHAHADHLSGSQYLKANTGAGVVISENIRVVQETFKTIFNLPSNFPTDGSQFDKLVKDNETFMAGSLPIKVINTPGHTPACVTFHIGDALFTGDALFMDDYGTGRCDFPAGSAAQLYESIQRLYALPDSTRVFVGHDYQPGNRAVMWETTIGKSKQNNPQIKGNTSKDDFVKFREARDATLQPPRLIFQSVQVNVDAGRLPKAQGNGIRYLATPLNLFGPTDDLGSVKK